jgi:hypothetical protein
METHGIINLTSDSAYQFLLQVVLPQWLVAGSKRQRALRELIATIAAVTETK